MVKILGRRRSGAQTSLFKRQVIVRKIMLMMVMVMLVMVLVVTIVPDMFFS